VKLLDRTPNDSNPPPGLVAPETRSDLDPRVRARRIQVRRAVGRRRFWVLVAVVVPLLIATAAVAALWSPLVGVRTVEVVGTSQLDPAVVRTAAALKGGTPMMKVSSGSIEARVLDVPLVATVRVERRWPSTVRIFVTERRPVVTVKAPDGSWREVDIAGRVLVSRPDRPALSLVEGPGAVGDVGSYLPAQAATAVRAAAALTPVLRAVVRTVTWDASGGAALVLGSGVPVKLGATDRVSEQMVALSALLPALGMTPVSEIDLTVPDRPVVSHPGDNSNAGSTTSPTSGA